MRTLIKKLISQKTITYAEIADRLKVSESSVKRVMTKKRMTVSDFELYCKALGLNPYDVFILAHDDGKHQDELTWEQEDFLCRNPTLDYIYLKLCFGFSGKTLAEELKITPSKLKKLLKKIERYGLIKLTSSLEPFPLKNPPFKWIEGGPFEKAFGALVPSFLSEHFLKKSKAAEPVLFSRAFELYLADKTFAEWREELEALNEKYRRKSRTEMGLVPIEDLKPYSFLFGADQLDLWRAIFEQRRTENR